MKNNFQQWMDEEEERFDSLDEIESNLVGQVKSFSFFGNVVELFVPNALQTVVKLIGGDHDQNSGGDFRRSGGSPDSGRAFLRKPSNTGPMGG